MLPEHHKIRVGNKLAVRVGGDGAVVHPADRVDHVQVHFLAGLPAGAGDDHRLLRIVVLLVGFDPGGGVKGRLRHQRIRGVLTAGDEHVFVGRQLARGLAGALERVRVVDRGDIAVGRVEQRRKVRAEHEHAVVCQTLRRRAGSAQGDRRVRGVRFEVELLEAAEGFAADEEQRVVGIRRGDVARANLVQQLRPGGERVLDRVVHLNGVRSAAGEEDEAFSERARGMPGPASGHLSDGGERLRRWIEGLRGPGAVAAGQQDLAVGQQVGRVTAAASSHRRRDGFKHVSRRNVDLRGRQRDAIRGAAGNQHATIGQQRRGVANTRSP